MEDFMNEEDMGSNNEHCLRIAMDRQEVWLVYRLVNKTANDSNCSSENSTT